MDDKNKDSSINKECSGDKTKIVKTQKRENKNDNKGNINNEGSALMNPLMIFIKIIKLR
ncbi:hypothetical protein QTO16_29605 [Vibrio harveyi]|uniref:hypothetical protein n=1 Tax=Vibrio harveyi TaxID=669 RepID=UPI002F3F2C2D